MVSRRALEIPAGSDRVLEADRGRNDDTESTGIPRLLEVQHGDDTENPWRIAMRELWGAVDGAAERAAPSFTFRHIEELKPKITLNTSQQCYSASQQVLKLYPSTC